MTQGPNVKRLIVEKMARDAVPPGGGVADAVNFLKGGLVAGVKAATAWVEYAIKSVREAAEPNPWKGSTDEEIAGELLCKIREKRNDCPKCGGQKIHTRLSGYQCVRGCS